jgi:hypothetical protein
MQRKRFESFDQNLNSFQKLNLSCNSKNKIKEKNYFDFEENGITK